MLFLVSNAIIFKILLYSGAFLFIYMVRSSQKTTKRSYSVNTKPLDAKNSHSIKRNEDKDQSTYYLVLELIKEFNYILISNSVNANKEYEIIFKNYESKLFKREPTFIKIIGQDGSKDISYYVWSERYEYGQNSRNDSIAIEFLKRL